MYNILIKYTSTSSKTFWYTHEVEQEDGNMAEFETNDLEILKTEIDKLDKEIGYENIRVVDDITYSVMVKVNENEYIEEFTSADIDKIYETAYNQVFSDGGDTE